MAKLPAELTDRVIDFLHSDKRALAACSLVCNSWAPTSRYHLFREITITPANSRSFTILFGFTTSKTVNEQPRSLILGISKVPRETEFSSYVHKVSWTVEHGSLTHSIMQIISSLPLLSEFFITRSTFVSCPTFRLLKRIKKLSFKGYFQNAVPEIASAIANNPELEYLDISKGDFYDHSGYAPHVRDFFARIPSGSPPLKLQHLGVGQFRLGLDATIVPHLRSLTSLEWLHPWDIEGGDDKASSEEVWKILKLERIPLSRLRTSVMNEDFLEFLSSSQGISELRLDWISGKYDSRPIPFSRTFFQDVLPRLADTLKVLRIDADYEENWCFNANNLDSILNCINLQELTISLYWPKSPESSESAPVALLLNNISQLSHLRFLEILPAIKIRGAFMPNKTALQQNQVYPVILGAVERFETLGSDDDIVGLIGYELRVGEWRMFVPRT